MKVCQQCGAEKDFCDFYKDSRNLDGLYVVCKSCHKVNNKNSKIKNRDRVLASQKEYREVNKEVLKEKGNQYRRNNKEKVAETCKKHREKNKEKILEYNRKYRETHKEEIHQYYLSRKDSEEYKEVARAAVRNRRARRNYIEGKITKKEWLDLLEKYGYKCLKCGRTDVKLELDHVVPLAVGGEHSIRNAQPLCRSCNGGKHTKIEDYR